MFEARAKPPHRNVRSRTSCRFCGRRRAISAMQAPSRPSSSSETLPRIGSSGQVPGPRRKLVASVDLPLALILDAEIGCGLLAEQPGRAEDHHPQEQDEEEQ